MVRGEIEARISREIGHHLRRIRGAHGWSLLDLCERVSKLGFELTESSLSRMERGKALLGTPIMSAIAACLGTSLGEIDQIIRQARLTEDLDLTGKDYDSLYEEGRHIARSGNLIKALQLFTAAHDWLLMQDPPATNDHRLPDALIWQSFLYARIRNFRLAIDHSLRVLNLKTSNADQMASAMCTLVFVGRLSDDFYSARLYADELANHIDSLSPHVKARALSVLGELEMHEKAFSKATKYYEKALEAYHEIGDRAEVARTKANLGYSLFCAGTRVGGFELITKALAMARNEDCVEVSGYALRCLGITELLRRNYTRASSLLEDAATIARRLGDMSDEFEGWLHLWKHHKKLAKDPESESRRLQRKLNVLARALDPTIPEVKEYLADLSLTKRKGARK